MAFWFAIPVVAVLGKVIYDAVTDDDNTSSSYNDRDKQGREAKEKSDKKKKKKIRKEISNYKKEQILQIKEKYATFIEFKFTKVKSISKDNTLQNKIINLKKETTELEESIKELEDIKNETLR